MNATICTLEYKSFLRLPDILREGWNIAEGCYIHVTVNDKILTISKAKKGRGVILKILSGFGVDLPFYFIKSLGLKVGDEMQLTLGDNFIHLHKNSVQPISSPIRNKNKLAAKLGTELETKLKISSKNHSNILFEDIYNFLLLDSWSDEAVKSLLAKENLLNEVANRLREDDIFNHIFEERLRKVTLDYITSREIIPKKLSPM